jgi:DNA-binding response OmpR family regulator
VKPFALEELMARVRAVLRRRGAIPQVLEAGRCSSMKNTGSPSVPVGSSR